MKQYHGPMNGNFQHVRLDFANDRVTESDMCGGDDCACNAQPREQKDGYAYEHRAATADQEHGEDVLGCNGQERMRAHKPGICPLLMRLYTPGGGP